MRSVSGSARGQENDGSMRELGMRANGLADLQAVGIREHDVQNDEVGLFTAAEIDGALAGPGAGKGEAFLFQVVLDQREKVGVILD